MTARLSSRAPKGRGEPHARRLLRPLRGLAMTEKAVRPRNDRKGCSTPAKEGASGSGGDVVRTGLAVAVAAVVLLTMSGLGAGQQPVTITYWQYFFQSKVTLVDEVIKQFEAQNPGIHVVHENFRYDAYNQKVASAVPAGQDHQMIREVLFRQWGVAPYSADGKRVTYATPQGAEALKWYTDLITQHNVGVIDFFPGGNGYRDAFIAGRAAMIVDGSFAIASVRAGAKAAWGVVPLPRRTLGGERSNFGSYWVHGITVHAQGPRREAAIKFLKFLVSEPVQRVWLQRVGELPASRKLVDDPQLAADPIYGPFIQGLAYARATFFVDETAQRQVLVDAVNEVVVNNKPPRQALDEAAAKEQKILDEFWKKHTGK